MPRYLANVIGASIGGVAGIFAAKYLVSWNVPSPAALGLGALVTGVATEVISVSTTATLGWTRRGRYWLDPRSAFEGRWIEDFQGANPERPYTIVDLTYQPDRGGYSANGRPFDDKGNPMGVVAAPDVLVHVDGLTLAYRYEAVVTAGGVTSQESVGFGELIFRHRQPTCREGTGRIFGRGDAAGEIHFRLVRVDRKLRKKLKLKSHADECDLVRAYHALHTAAGAAASPP